MVSRSQFPLSVSQFEVSREQPRTNSTDQATVSWCDFAGRVAGIGAWTLASPAAAPNIRRPPDSHDRARRAQLGELARGNANLPIGVCTPAYATPAFAVTTAAAMASL